MSLGVMIDNYQILGNRMIIKSSKRICRLEAVEKPLFFSLMEYLNNYFTSNDLEKITTFYNFFPDKYKLIEWMIQRPKGVTNISEIEGDTDIVIVIPTANVNGKYAQECKNTIFKGFKIIFVESAENPDPYFNYSHSCNTGIKKALEYNPKWVVLSNDDVIFQDEPYELKSQLDSIDEDTEVVFSKPTNYHSYDIWISRIRLIFFIRMFFSKERNFMRTLKMFGIKYTTVGEPNNNVLSILYNKLYFKKLFVLKQIGSFGIFSSQFLNRFNSDLLDETFINHMEDMDLSLRLYVRLTKFGVINYNISDRIGSSIGRGEGRKLRSIASQVYFIEKNKKLL